MSARLPGCKCLHCGRLLDGATGVGTAADPEPGSLSLCAYCGAVTIYDDDLRLRPLTAAEAGELASDAETMAILRKATHLIHFFKAGRN